MTQLLIVESPAKAKKIAGFLGESWRVEACRGHLRDLPETEVGVDLEHDFRPTYTTLKGKTNLVKRLVKAIRGADAVYLGTDPDREGEAIAWHLLALAQPPKTIPIHRVTFAAITADAVRTGINAPREIDHHLVEAQIARRIVDRLVGYLVSPLACKALDGRFSAGRVQSACLRLLVEREREIADFTPQPYHTLALQLRTPSGDVFTADLHKIKDGDPQFRDRVAPEKLGDLLRRAEVWVDKVATGERTRSPLPPFTTSTLQQAAAKGLDLSPERTMALAQTLYEAGMITYHRTDGVSVAPEAAAAAREHIRTAYGSEYLPDTPPVYRAKTQGAQEAHEALRPADVHRLPEAVEGEGAALYRLIWSRFIASQMAPARYAVTNGLIRVGKAQGQPIPLVFRAHGRSLVFPGFLNAYIEPEDVDAGEDEAVALPVFNQGEGLTLEDVTIGDHQTRPPARFTEASLVGELERGGIGRPSTYAATVALIKRKGYVTLDRKRLTPTAAGVQLNDFLIAHFPDLFAADYTAGLEARLDAVAAGQVTRLSLLRSFWSDFQPRLGAAAQAATDRRSDPLVMRPKEA